MRLKRSAALVFLPKEDALLGVNFLQKSYFNLAPPVVGFVLSVPNWRDLIELQEEQTQLLDGFMPLVRRLVEVGALVVEGSTEAVRDEAYASSWEWGPVAGLHHFLSSDMEYLTIEEGYDWLKIRAREKIQPVQFEINRGPVTDLPYPDMSGELFQTMLKRRSERKFVDRPMSQQALADVLYAGFGITAMVDDDELGWLPLTMSPSGGARNPFEGYVAIRDVEGMAKGVYHYDGAAKNLSIVSIDLPSRAAMVGEQAWADDANAVVFLVAHFERTMWKYPNPAAYRVVLIEAGHIVQNMMLATVKHGMVSAPTSAVSDSSVGGLLSPQDVTRSALYTLSLGHAGVGFDTLY